MPGTLIQRRSAIYEFKSYLRFQFSAVVPDVERVPLEHDALHSAIYREHPRSQDAVLFLTEFLVALTIDL